jgi:hypothetical protein
VVATNGRTATVTNEDGIFSLRSPAPHATSRCRAWAIHAHGDVPCRGASSTPPPPPAVTLNEVLVANAEDVLRLAINNIPENYAAHAPAATVLLSAETTRKGRKYIYVARPSPRCTRHPTARNTHKTAWPYARHADFLTHLSSVDTSLRHPRRKDSGGGPVNTGEHRHCEKARD